MEDPVTEIPRVIRLLTQSPPSTQRAAVEKYFTPSASFTHPFCRSGSFEGSRWLIWCIYRWYKIMSPRIDINVDGIAYDERNLTLYVNIHQVFRIWIVPFFNAPVSLVTVLKLKALYFIQSQNDLYQVNEFSKFFSPFGILSGLLLVAQFVATALCILGATIFWPVSWVEQNVIGGNREKSIGEAVRG
ncbi:MAG: hypothetical protein Q9182_005395 [Xanthomendoza sp. 2 TL-2023]